MKQPVMIIGGGLAGLITACHFPNSIVYEAGERAPQHKALLRFRGEEVSRITGIPFKAVTVDKAVYFRGNYYHDHCPINLANMYSMKVTNQFGSRSIMKLKTATRYIAPDDFYDQLVDKLGDRIFFNTPVDALCGYSETPIINTSPLPVMMKLAGIDQKIDFSFDKANIRVYRFKIKRKCELYQTIYFPDYSVRTYRASITGDTLIIETIPLVSVSEAAVEAAGGITRYRDIKLRAEVDEVLTAFGLSWSDIALEEVEKVDQKYGKIVDIPKDLRHALLLQLTMDLNVFSVGRFATWRNILLDDVAHDLAEVEKLIKANNYQKFAYIANK